MAMFLRRYLNESFFFYFAILALSLYLKKKTDTISDYIFSSLDAIINLHTVTTLSLQTLLRGRVESGLEVRSVMSATQAKDQEEIYASQQRIGSINFAAVITRPDVAHAASKPSEYLTNPSKRHFECANRVLLHLAHTKNLSIEFDAQTISSRRVFLASSDASFANDPDTRQSSQRYAFMLFNGAIDWKACKQKTVTTSSTETELLAMSSTGKETIWWARLSESINFDPCSCRIWRQCGLKTAGIMRTLALIFRIKYLYMILCPLSPPVGGGTPLVNTLPVAIVLI